MFHGITELFVAIEQLRAPRPGVDDLSILGIVMGVIVVIAPCISPYALTLVVGIRLVLFGAMSVVRSLQIRAAASGPGSHPLPA